MTTIEHVSILKVTGQADASAPWLPWEARSVSALDVYEEFRQQRPNPRSRPDGPIRVEAVFVEIETDNCVTGLYGPISEEQAYLIAHRFRPLLTGRDALGIETLWDLMVHFDRHARCGLWMMAISAVDCALWDLKGKCLGQPVYRLLGGFPRDEVPAYASMLGHSAEPDQAAKAAQAAADAGYQAQKWFFPHGPGCGTEGRKANLAMADALREGLGEDSPLMFDCWMGWDLPYALEMSASLKAVRPRWLEEPFAPNQIEAYRQLAAKTGLPLAAGEHLYTRWDVRPYLDAGVLTTLQADPDWTGGISELVRICGLAEAYGVPVIPHGHNLHAALHVVASRSPRVCPMVEYLLKHLPRQQFFFRRAIFPQAGCVAVPDAPGLGIELDEDRIEHSTELFPESGGASH